MALVNLLETVRRDLTANANDSARLELSFKQGGAAIDMSGYSSSVAEVQDAATGEVIASWGIDYTDAVTGTIVLTLTVADIAAIKSCKAIWFFQAILAADPPNNSHTVIGGKFTVKQPEAIGG